ncbi:MAG: hypothetical protein LBR08_06005 [Bacteroidales bacterium]|jgi:hypothetical protein|nr:hypothetical protein [Bacteroidales bacterium]
MLAACSTIIDNALANQDFLASKRVIWAPPFFETLKKRIDGDFRKYLGVGTKAGKTGKTAQPRITKVIVTIQAQAMINLAEAKVQIEEDFKFDRERRDFILKELGFITYYKRARAKDQKALAQLLYRFKSGLTLDMQNEIIRKGTSADTIARIVAYADLLAATDVPRDAFGSSKKAITDEAIMEFNEVYNEVISIAKIAHTFFKGNTAIQDGFSYNNIRGKLNIAAKVKSKVDAGAKTKQATGKKRGRKPKIAG